MLLDLHDLVPSIVMMRQEHFTKLVDHIDRHLDKLLLMFYEYFETKYVQLASLIPTLFQYHLFPLIILLLEPFNLDHDCQLFVNAQRVKIGF